MPTWMWLNIPLLVLVFAAVVGISYWLVLKHPDQDAPTTPKPVRGAGEVPAQSRREERDVRDDREQDHPVMTGRR